MVPIIFRQCKLLDLRMEDRTNVRVRDEEEDLGRLERLKVEM